MVAPPAALSISHVSPRQVLDVLEAATITREPTDVWATRVAAAAGSLVAGTRHASLVRYDLSDCSLSLLRPESATVHAAITGGQDSLDQEGIDQVYRAAPSAHTSTEVFGERLPDAYTDLMDAAGLADCVGIAATSGDASCLGLALLTERRTQLGQSARTRLAGLGAQLGAAVRVYDAIRALRSGTADRPESGAVAARLAHAVRELDAKRARAVRDRTEDAALDVEELWTSLLHDGWALVPMEHSAQRTRLVAVRVRRPAATMARRLQPEERDVVLRAARGLRNKEIAYELGVAEPTVATRLRRAQQKLGIERRTDLVRVLGGLA